MCHRNRKIIAEGIDGSPFAASDELRPLPRFDFVGSITGRVNIDDFIRSLQQVFSSIERQLERFSNRRCESPAVTEQERDALRRGDVLAFWRSRAARGDPFASTALNVIMNRGLEGYIANSTLAGSIRGTYGTMPTATVQSTMTAISGEIAAAHVSIIDRYGGASARDIAQYHYQIFAEHGLSPNTFSGGGTIQSDIGTNVIFKWSGCR